MRSRCDPPTRRANPEARFAEKVKEAARSVPPFSAARGREDGTLAAIARSSLVAWGLIHHHHSSSASTPSHALSFLILCLFGVCRSGPTWLAGWREVRVRVVVTLRYVTLRYVTLRYVTVPLGEGYVRPLCSPGDAIYARSSPARPGRRGVTRRRLQGSCTVLQQPGAQGDTLFRLWWLDHSPIFSLAARRAPSWQVRLGLRYVT